jgi:hypothetical protein
VISEPGEYLSSFSGNFAHHARTMPSLRAFRPAYVRIQFVFVTRSTLSELISFASISLASQMFATEGRNFSRLT